MHSSNALRGLLVAVLLIVVVPGGIALAGVTKATFRDVTFPDGQTGVITVASKITGNGSTHTTCDYYTDNFVTYLGQYQDATFASADPATLRDFCLSHFNNRT